MTRVDRQSTGVVADLPQPAMLRCAAEEEERRRSFLQLFRRPVSASSGWDLWPPARPAASGWSRGAGPWVHRLVA